MEVADVFAINKADRPGVDETRRDLEQMLELAAETAAPTIAGWRVPIVPDGGRRRATASPSCGTPCSPTAHHMTASGVLEQRRRFRLGEELREIVARRLEAAGPRALHRRALGRADRRRCSAATSTRGRPPTRCSRRRRLAGSEAGRRGHGPSLRRATDRARRACAVGVHDAHRLDPGISSSRSGRIDRAGARPGPRRQLVG